jgi:hypothetical protein
MRLAWAAGVDRRWTAVHGPTVHRLYTPKGYVIWGIRARYDSPERVVGLRLFGRRHRQKHAIRGGASPEENGSGAAVH